MKRVVLVVLAVSSILGLVSCGGGGGGESLPPVTPPSSSLVGTYRMTGFTVENSNGITFTEHSPEVINWSGTMTIGTTTTTQSIVLNDTPVSVTGAYTVTWKDDTSGTFHLIDQSGAHDVSFTISGNNLTTYSGILDAGGGFTFEEWDYWVKVSDSQAPEMQGSVPEKSVESAYTGKRWIGELLTQ